MKQSTYLASCSHYWCNINSEDDLNTCSTVGCLFKLCSKKSCHHYIDKNNYCVNCKRTSIIVLEKDNIVCEKKSEREERIFED